jgi:hypothetical protein
MQTRRKRFRTKEQQRKASERTRRGWETRRANGTDTWGTDDRPPDRVQPGEYLGTLRWLAPDGKVTQCVVRQGERANRIRVGRTECGWDFLFRRMRGRLSSAKRIFNGEAIA